MHTFCLKKESTDVELGEVTRLIKCIKHLYLCSIKLPLSDDLCFYSLILTLVCLYAQMAKVSQ